jgi:CRP/FNR family transcriptional regulator
MDPQVCEASAVSGAPRGRGQVACSQCSLGRLCLPRNLDSDGIHEFERIVQKLRPLQRGEHIFRAGEAFSAIVSVRSGSFKSYVINEEGEEQVLGFHLPGEIIGLDAIHATTHTANVVALDTSSVCAINFESVSDMARHLPELQAELFRIMSRHIAELEANAADLTADQRIARFLQSLSTRFARRGYSASEFNLSMARRDIASHLRLATETVSRVLARFQEAGIVTVRRKNIVIEDFDALEAASHPPD